MLPPVPAFEQQPVFKLISRKTQADESEEVETNEQERVQLQM